ncbi:MAG TPA: response regulator, partial [Bryobacteraceae bacterium]|nr:response regulator [Bryobacteraceae bacterium]
MIENRTILLIDDEPQIRRVLRTSLGSKGARVLDAASGEEGIEMLRRETVDLILLDLNMPGMGGLAACRAIRSGWDMPIVVVSVRDSDHDKVEA